MTGLGWEPLFTRISTVLCKAAIHGDPMGFKVFAEQFFAPTAIETFAAELRVVRTHPFPNLEALHVPARRRDDTDRLMARDEGKPGQELALVDVQVCAADTAGFNLDEHIVVPQLREVDLNDAVVFRLGVPIE